MARYVWWCKIHQEIECLDYGRRSRGYTILFINYQKSMEITQTPNNEKYCFLLVKQNIEFDRFPTDSYFYDKNLLHFCILHLIHATFIYQTTWWGFFFRLSPSVFRRRKKSYSTSCFKSGVFLVQHLHINTLM